MLGFDVKDFLFITTVDGHRHAICRHQIERFEETPCWINIKLSGNTAFADEWICYQIREEEDPLPV